MTKAKEFTGYPSIDKPWLKYYKSASDLLDIPSPDCSMVEYLHQCNKNRLDNIALNYYGTKISFRSLFMKIDHVAAALQAHGVRKGDIVTLCALNTPEFVYLLYALNKIGAVSNWIGLTSPCEDLHNQLVSTDTRIVFTVSIAYHQITEAVKDSKVESIISVPIEESMPVLLRVMLKLKSKGSQHGAIQWHDFIKTSQDMAETTPVCSNDLAIIEYTGGSTGVPKGVMLSNRNLNSYYCNLYKTNESFLFAYREKDRYLGGVPFFLAYGISAGCHAPLAHSMELVLAPDPSPTAAIKMIIKYKPNHIIAGRLMVDELVAYSLRNNNNLSFIRSLIYGGEGENREWEKDCESKLRDCHLNAPILNGYGMTETAAGILLSLSRKEKGLVPMGNVCVKTVDPNDYTIECKYGEVGELCFSSDTVMLGYCKQDKDTKEVLFEENGTIWLKSRDLARINSDGIVQITGRIKRIYSKLTQDKIQVRVYPMRIEEILKKNELVQECAVVGIKDDSLAYRSIAYIILSEKTADVDVAKTKLETYCLANLPDSHWPDKYIFIDKFPINRAGKIDYLALEEMAKEM